jgi:hypothetical protein
LGNSKSVENFQIHEVHSNKGIFGTERHLIEKSPMKSLFRIRWLCLPADLFLNLPSWKAFLPCPLCRDRFPIMTNGACSVLSLEGYLSNGDYATTVSIAGPDGMSASILTLGARLLDLRTPSGRGLVLPLATIEKVEADCAYIGVVVGRTANRVRDGLLCIAGKSSRELERNEDSVNHIHGGQRGWDKRIYSVRSRGASWVELYLFSPEGDQGYPSALDVTVRYELRAGGQLCIDLKTCNVGSESTVTNMTVHPYFDLSGGYEVDDACTKLRAVFATRRQSGPDGRDRVGRVAAVRLSHATTDRQIDAGWWRV